MTSPRETDFINTHTHHTGNRINPEAILGSMWHHPSKLSPGTLSSKKSLGVAMTEPPIFQVLLG